VHSGSIPDVASTFEIKYLSHSYRPVPLGERQRHDIASDAPIAAKLTRIPSRRGCEPKAVGRPIRVTRQGGQGPRDQTGANSTTHCFAPNWSIAIECDHIVASVSVISTLAAKRGIAA
jgi:hypothetical protein